jgi:hypothetical protein
VLLLLLLLQGSTVPNGTMVVGGHDDLGLTTYVASSWRGSYTPVPGHLFSKSHYRQCNTLSHRCCLPMQARQRPLGWIRSRSSKLVRVATLAPCASRFKIAFKPPGSFTFEDPFLWCGTSVTFVLLSEFSALIYI